MQIAIGHKKLINEEEKKSQNTTKSTILVGVHFNSLLFILSNTKTHCKHYFLK